MDADVRVAVDAIYRNDSRRVLATLIRLLGDFERAEEAMHDAFAAAVTRWPLEGVPANPVAWLISAARFKSIDAMRRQARFNAATLQVTEQLYAGADDAPLDIVSDDEIVDDQLRLIFICCHPALAPEAQIALTLREVCGLTTEEIARAFLTAPPTVAQRIVRAKGKIRDAKIPYAVPERAELAARLDAVLRVIYLVFNEGYSASGGPTLTRVDLSAEAIRLGRLLHTLLPEAEVDGLLALMVLHESRRATRVDANGRLILLEDQDRSRWDAAMIAEGSARVQRALGTHRFGPYTLQAAIAAIHAEAPSADQTDWAEVVGLYDVLLRIEQSPVVALNRAVAVAMRDSPEAGLAEIDRILARGELAEYHLAHAARADLCRRLGRWDDARAAYTRALALAKQAPEREFLLARRDALPTNHG